MAAIVPTCFVTYDLLNSSFHGNVERGVSTEVLIFAVVSVIPYLASNNVSRRIIIPLLPTPSVASISQDRDSFHISVETASLQNLTEVSLISMHLLVPHPYASLLPLSPFGPVSIAM